MERLDVLVVATTVFRNDHPPPKLPFVLGPDLRLDTLGPLTEPVIEACTLPGFPPGGIDPRFIPYAFVRSNPPDDGLGGRGWDPDERITRAVALSRLVWPNSVWFEHTARIELDGAGELRAVRPIVARRKAYVADPTARPWLTQAEAQALAFLLARYEALDLPRPTQARLPTALWFAEHVAQTEFFEIRWVETVTALEALLATSGERIAAQFTVRFPALAKALGFTWATRTQARKIYEIRSAIVHGAHRQDAPRGRETNELRLKVEEVLRAALRKAIEDDEFRASFDSNEAISYRWGQIPPT